MNRFHTLFIGLAGCMCGLTIAACAGSGSTGTGTGTAAGAVGASRSDKPLQYAKCMRSHGVPNFPDPGAQGGIQLTPGSGVNPQSPAFQSAQQACAKLGPGGPGGGPVSSANRRSALAFSKCMRAHGVPNFPDPIFPKGGGIMIGGADPSSPAFQKAQATCGRP
ncbi:MAG: hypothetical protein WAK93_13490 [Solirubrobacteraceae bacterium]